MPLPTWERRSSRPSRRPSRRGRSSSSLMVRRDLQARFPEWADAAVDVVYCLELSRLGQIVLVPQPLTGYRRRHGNMTSDATFGFRCHQTILRWLEMNKACLSVKEDLRIR